MKQILVNSAVSTNLNLDFNQVQTIEIEDKPFNEGAFGEVYQHVSINGLKTTTPQIIKIFKDNLSGSADLNYNTIQKLQIKLSNKNDELLANQKKTLIEAFPAFLAIPQFSFTGTLNGQTIKGFSSNNLKSLGFEEFKEILENDTLLDHYQSLPIEKKMIIAYHFVSAFKLLKECSYIHADIKPEAIFINTKNDTCAIIDFDSGVVTDKIGDDATTWGAPNDWVAPEIWNQLGQVSNQQRKIQVDLFTDTWSVAIGIHYFFATCHPLFFLTELSPNVINDYFNKHNNKWPHINKNVSYFNQQYSAIYDQYLNFLNANIPQEVREQLASTINQGYLKPLFRTTYDKWKNVLEKTQQPPNIIYFEADQPIAVSAVPIKLKWHIENAYSISINNGVGDVTGLSEVQISPQNHTTYTIKATGYYGTSNAETKVKIFPTPLIETLFIPTPDFNKGVNITPISISTPNILNNVVLDTSLKITIPQFSELNQSIVSAKPILKKDKISMAAIFERIKQHIFNKI